MASREARIKGIHLRIDSIHPFGMIPYRRQAADFIHGFAVILRVAFLTPPIGLRPMAPYTYSVSSPKGGWPHRSRLRICAMRTLSPQAIDDDLSSRAAQISWYRVSFLCTLAEWWHTIPLELMISTPAAWWYTIPSKLMIYTPYGVILWRVAFLYYERILGQQFCTLTQKSL